MKHLNVTTHPYAAPTAVVVAALTISAIVNRKLAKKAERENPATGKFVEVDGVRLHYFERGVGEPLVLLHGIDSMVQDFESSGLIEMAAKKYRVIAFDRPGFGYSARPRGEIWSPEAQAELIHRALEQIGISRAIVLGHSWGASVAVALALKHPSAVSSDSGLGILLPDRAVRRCCRVRSSGAGHRRHHELHPHQPVKDSCGPSRCARSSVRRASKKFEGFLKR